MKDTEDITNFPGLKGARAEAISEERLLKFLTLIVEELGPASALSVSSTMQDRFSDDFKSELNITSANSFPALVEVDKAYDFIFAEFPFGLKRTETDKNQITDIPLNRGEYEHYLGVLRALNLGGLAFIPTTQSLFFSRPGERFLQALRKEGISVSAVFELPPIISGVAVPLVLSAFSRGEQGKLYVSSLRDLASISSVVKGFFGRIDRGSVESGLLIELDQFETIEKVKIQLELDAMRPQFRAYTFCSLRDLTIKEVDTEDGEEPRLKFVRGERVIRAGAQFSDEPNALYIPRLMMGDPKASLTELRGQQKHYTQISIDPEKCLSEFLACFFTSSFGERSLNSARRALGSSVSAILDHDAFFDLTLPIPDLAQQKLTIDLHKKLHALQLQVDQLESELAVTPIGGAELDTKITSMLQLIGAENATQRVRRLAREGESKTVEFKQTFQLDIDNGSKRKELARASLKTIVAFLNTDGGSLLIGVHDSGELIGLKDEIELCAKGSADSFLNSFKEVVKAQIGADYFPFIEHSLIEVEEGKVILCVDCARSPRECYLQGKNFFVRTNPASDELTGRELVEYTKTRFGNS